MTTIEKIIEGLKTSALELEKLQVQAALGKAEAKQKYEDARRKFNADIQNAKNAAKEKYEEIKPLLESLQVQFALGKAEAKEKFDTNMKKFSEAIREIETILKKI